MSNARLTLTAVFAVTLLCACQQKASDPKGTGAFGDSFRPVAVGDMAPAYAVRTLAGDSMTIGPGEPPTLLNVWATWCTSCREEFALLERMQTAYGPRGLRIIAVSVDQGDVAKVKEAVRTDGVTFAVAHDPDRRIEDMYPAIGVPASYLVGRNGRLLWKYVGALPPSVEAQIRRAVDLGPATTPRPPS